MIDSGYVHQKNHYINNDDFYKALLAYHDACHAAREAEKPIPEIPRYIAECIMLISEHQSTKYNFFSYPFRDEMVADGIADCVNAVHKFNPYAYKNPFMYFTRTVSHAFIRRIKQEQTHLYVKYKAFMNDKSMSVGLEEDDPTSNEFEIYENMDEFIMTYEARIERAKEKKQKQKQKTGLPFEGDDDEDAD